MKLLLVSERFPPVWGGSRVYYYEVFRRLPAAEVEILTKRVDGHADFDAKESLHIHRRFEAWPNADYRTLTKYPGYIAYLTWKLLRSGADLVHSGDSWPAGVFAITTRALLGVPYIHYSHGEDQTQVVRSRFRKHVLAAIFDQADLLIANSRFTYDMLLERGLPEAKIRLITPGVDFDRFSVPVACEDLRLRYDLQGRQVLLTVARFEPRKGFDTALRALKLLTDKHPNLVYLMVGKGIDKPRIEALVQELDLPQRVRMVDDVSQADLVRHYALCDVFILANRGFLDSYGQLDVEGFGMVFLEAGCQKKPVIGGRSGGTVDAVEHGVSGLLCEPDSPEDFARAIDSLLSDPNLARRMGEAGYERAHSQFRWETRAQEIRRISEELVGKRKPGLVYRALRRLVAGK